MNSDLTPYFNATTSQIMIPPNMQSFKGGKTYLWTSNYQNQKIANLWFCAGDFRSLVQNKISLEIFSQQGLA